MEYILKNSYPEWVEFPCKSKNYISFIPCHILLQCIKIETPEIQRELDFDWIQELRKKIDIEFSRKGFYDFGRFDIASLDDKLYLLNGQHRYQILQNHKYNDILVEVKIYTCDNRTHMEDVFMIVNGSRPSILAESSSTQIIINKIRKHFSTHYGMYLSHSKNPHKPNINLDKMCECIIESKILDDISCDFDRFIQKVEKLNNIYLYSSKDQQISWKIKDFDKYLTKCRQKSPINVFVLGIISNYKWIYQLDQCIHNVNNERINVNKHLKKLVWSKRNNYNLNGVCYVCCKNIDYDSFECGHVCSIFNGGETNLNNLEPICRLCNNDMGTTNLLDYKHKIESTVVC